MGRSNQRDLHFLLKGALAWIDSDMKPWREFYTKLPFFLYFPIEAIDVFFRGVGQVVLMNNSITGFFILVGLFYANWWIALCGAYGVIISTITAAICGFNPGAIRDGLHGYNGLLVGLALGTFAEPENYLVFIPILITAPFASVFLAFHAEVYKVPACTLPFCFATAIFLMGTYSFNYFPFTILWSNLSPYVMNPPPGEPISGIDVSQFFQSILTGTSQIFLASNVWTCIYNIWNFCEFPNFCHDVRCRFYNGIVFCFWNESYSRSCLFWLMGI